MAVDNTIHVQVTSGEVAEILGKSKDGEKEEKIESKKR
jgi:hypothetical protein